MRALFSILAVSLLLASPSTAKVAVGRTSLADIVDNIINVIEQALQNNDPLIGSGASISILGIEIEYGSASVSGHSAFSHSVSVDEESGLVAGSASLGAVAASIQDLKVSTPALQLSGNVDVNIGGVSLDFSLNYDTEERRFTSLSVVPSIKSASVSASLNLAGFEFDVDLDLAEYLDVINSFLEENQEAISEVLLVVVNAILCALL